MIKNKIEEVDKVSLDALTAKKNKSSRSLILCLYELFSRNKSEVQEVDPPSILESLAYKRDWVKEKGK